MIQKSAKSYLYIYLFCASFLSFSQDEGLILLEDADGDQIKFENHYFEALKYKAIGNYTRAITELEKCKEYKKKDISVAYELSKNYLQLGRFQEAQSYIEEVLKKAPKNHWYLDQAKQVYLKQYHFKKAIEIQERIIALEPKERENLIPLYIHSKDFASASNLMEKLEKEGYYSSKFKEYKRVINNYQKKKTRSNIKTVTNSKSLEQLKIDFENSKKYKDLAQILDQELASKNFDNLLKYSEKGLDLFPAQPKVYFMHAKALIAQNKHKEAISYLNDGIDFVVSNNNFIADFYAQLVICHSALNNTSDVEKYKKKEAEFRKKRSY